jgi:hypothetical protein
MRRNAAANIAEGTACSGGEKPNHRVNGVKGYEKQKEDLDRGRFRDESFTVD